MIIMKNSSFKRIPEIPIFKDINLISGKAEIKSKNKLDLSLVIFNNYANVASVMTKSKTCATNISWLKKIKNFGKVRVLFVNSGNANAYTGKEGDKNLKKIINYLSRYFSCSEKSIIVSSTGVIGEQLPINKIMTFIPKILHKYSSLNYISKQCDWKKFATSIMTTDTFPKISFKKTKIGNKTINIIGVAKGSGMIAPNMATMLAFIFTDVLLPPNILRELLENVNEKSFNSITVDSDTSTNDMVSFFSTKNVDCKIKSINDKKLKYFKSDLEYLSKDLAKKIIFDGEGAKKLIQIEVTEAKNYKDAKKIAFSIANSPLVKTAIAGEDANWGRVIMAIGKSNVAIKQDKISLKFGENLIIQKGELKKNYSEKKITKYLRGKVIVIKVSLGIGDCSSTVWTCDLTKEYIAINADYRS